MSTNPTMRKPGKVGRPKGIPKTGGGSRAGIPNKATANARAAIAEFVEGNVQRLNGWLDQIAEDDGPKAAFACVVDLLEYHVPKLARTEHTGLDGGTIKVESVEWTLVGLMKLQPKIGEAFQRLLKPARYKGAYGGRGSGKSHFFAELLVARACSKPGTRAVGIREVQRTLAQSSKRLIEDKISELGVASLFKISEREIRTPGDGVILFEGMQNHTADSIKSLEGVEIAWVEEAQNLSQRSLDLLRPTIRADGFELWFSWNPEKKTDPVDALLRCDKPPTNSIVIPVNWDANPWFPQVLREELEYDRRRDPDKFLHVWQGDYQRHSEARVFRNWRIEDFDTDPEWILRQGADWGFSVDPSVLVQCAIVGRTLYVCHEAYQIGCDIDFLPDLFRTVPDAERWPTIADSARPETISHMKRHGFPKMVAAIKGAKSLEEGVEFLRSFDVVVHPRCRHTSDELTAYSYETDPLTGLVLPKLKDKDNHVIDALRYACEGARRAGPREEEHDWSNSAAKGMVI